MHRGAWEAMVNGVARVRYDLATKPPLYLIKNYIYINYIDTRDMGLIPGSRRFPGRGHSHPLQYFCLENPLDRVACRAAVHRVSIESDMTEAT